MLNYSAKDPRTRCFLVSKCQILAMVIAVAFSLMGCNRTFAPPVKTTNFGVPGHLQGGQVEMALSGGYADMSDWDAPLHGSPFLTLALLDPLALEGGGEFVAGQAMMGWGGVRITPLNIERDKKYRMRKFGLDLAFGGGGGVGGLLCDNEQLEEDQDPCPNYERWDGKSWKDRSAAGFYAELGAGIRLGRRFGVFIRPSLQITTAENVPRTTWLNFVGGMQLRLSKRVRGHFTLGYYTYRNNWDEDTTLVADLGFSIVFGKVKGMNGDEKSPKVSILPTSNGTDLWGNY